MIASHPPRTSPAGRGTRRRRIRLSARLPVAGLLVAGLLLTTGCTLVRGSEQVISFAGELRLVSFDSCDTAADALRAAAIDHVGPWGFDGGVAASMEAGVAAVEPALPPGGAADAPAAGDAAGFDAGRAAPAPAGVGTSGADAGPAPAQQPSHSGTNVHEAGVDEPDLVKTDGRRIITVADGTLRVVDAQRRTEIGKVALHAGDQPFHHWQPADLLLHGDRALVLMQQSWAAVMPMPEPLPLPEPGAGEDRPGGGVTGGTSLPMPMPMPEPTPITGPRLLLVDIAAAPQVVGEYLVDGALVDARAVGPTVRVVVRSGPRLVFPMLDPAAGEPERLAANREAVRTADLADWLPRFQVTDRGDTRTGQVACTALSRPASYSGTSMLTVLTFDLTSGVLGDGDPISVVADGDTVYSNGTSLYVATDQRWAAPMPMPGGDVRDGEATDPARTTPQQRTEIYKFDTSQPGPPRYAAAGMVDGWLINQYAMSEWNGYLRVATTSGDVFWWRGSEPDSVSTVYVLAEHNGALVETGSVGGLGHGERIYSVRYAGPIGYVVTFRETDPFYTVDLRNPFAPKVLGELKITGYSAYLHPVDGDHVLGIGQEADLRGVVQGTQVSLFDVSDLTDPRLQAQHHVRFGSSEAEFDPHAFLWWPAERIVVVPLTVPAMGGPVPGFGRDTGGRDTGGRDTGGRDTGVEPGRSALPQSGALVLRLDGGDFTELALITHPVDEHWGHQPQIRRSLVIDDTLWTVSTAGLQANDLATLETVAWLPFR
jgi:hypothetical protein